MSFWNEYGITIPEREWKKQFETKREKETVIQWAERIKKGEKYQIQTNTEIETLYERWNPIRVTPKSPMTGGTERGNEQTDMRNRRRRQSDKEDDTQRETEWMKPSQKTISYEVGMGLVIASIRREHSVMEHCEHPTDWRPDEYYLIVCVSCRRMPSHKTLSGDTNIKMVSRRHMGIFHAFSRQCRQTTGDIL